jgi:hypothetical protein
VRLPHLVLFGNGVPTIMTINNMPLFITHR